MKRSRTILIAAAIAATASPVEGQHTISVHPVFSGTPATQLTRSAETVTWGFTIANNSPTPVLLKIATRPFYHSGGEPCGASEPHCTLSWHLDGRPVEPEQPVEYTLAAYGSTQISLMGKAGPLGFYDGSVVVGPAAPGTTLMPVQYPVRINREAANLGTDGVVLGPGGTRTAGVLGALAPIKLDITNGSGAVVQVPGVSAQLLRDEGSGNFSHDAGTLETTCGPKPQWPQQLADKQTLNCTIDLLDFATPGRYRLDVSLSGPGIVKATAAREFNVRYHWLYAGLSVLLGASAGGWFAGWQNSGRRRVLQSADALALRYKYEALAAEVPPADPRFKSRRIIDEQVRNLADILERLRTTSAADHALQIDEMAARLPLLHRFATLEKSFVEAGQPADAQTAYDVAIAAVATTPLPSDLTNKLEQLASALAAARAANARLAGVASDAPAQFFFRINGTASPAQLRMLVKRIDTAMLWITIALVSIIGIMTLWQPNTNWGDLGDVLVALFAGFAVTSAGTAGLRELTSGYAIGKIGQR
jgi:hypothetical protein